ncbi:hypothetical protein RB653_000185 [Dictyostelium firmibasis]|uniref:Uncharacterized protein n=1 Tax=Dictyostelium firmibasis TaxID=79012 RepID=A0AAN7TW97_9MYCE
MDNIYDYNNNNKDEILFWKFYRNKYIINLIFQHLITMKINYNNPIDRYKLGNRIQFKDIISLSWIIKKSKWSILKMKLIHNEYIFIKSTSIDLLLKECKKDRELLKLIIEKKWNEMNQVDLVLKSIEHSNLVALKLMVEDFNLPFDKKSMDMALNKADCKTDNNQTVNFEILQYFWDQKKESINCTKSLVFKDHFNPNILKFLIDNSDLYKGEPKNTLIPQIQFFEYCLNPSISEEILNQMIERELVQIEPNMSIISQNLQKLFKSSSLYLPKSVYQFLNKNYEKKQLLQFPFIIICYLMRILFEYPQYDDSHSKLKEFLKDNPITLNILKTFSSQLQIFTKIGCVQYHPPPQKLKIIKTLKKSSLPLVGWFISNTYPIQQLNSIKETRILFDSLLEKKNLVCDTKVELVLKSFYHLNIIKTSNLQLLEQFLKEFSTKRDRELLFNGNDQVSLNQDYFKDCTLDDGDKILEFLNRLCLIKEFNSDSIQFLNCLKFKLLPISNDLFLRSLIILKNFSTNSTVTTTKAHNLLNNYLIDFIETNGNIYKKILPETINDLFKFFFNNFSNSETFKLLDCVIGSCDLEFLKIILDSQKEKKLKYKVKTINFQVIEFLISNYSNWFSILDFTRLLDELVIFYQDNNQFIEMIEKIINFQISNEIYQTSLTSDFDDLFFIGDDDDGGNKNEAKGDDKKNNVSIKATNLAYENNFNKVLLLLLNYKEFFYWDKNIFSNLPTLPNNINKTKQVETKEPIIEEIEKNEIYFDDFGNLQNVNYLSSNSKIISKIVRTIGDIDLVMKSISFILLKEPSSNHQYIIKVGIFKSLKYHKFEMVERLFSLLSNENQNNIHQYFLDSTKYKNSGIDLEIVKYFLFHKIFNQFDEFFKNDFVQDLLNSAIVQSNLQVCEWLFSNNNPYLKYFDNISIYNSIPISESIVFKNHLKNKFNYKSLVY